LRDRVIAFALPPGPLKVLCLGAHPDDIEIACGGTILGLAARSDVTATVAIATGSAARQEEGRAAAAAFWGEHLAEVAFLGLSDGRLPASWADLKQALEDLAARTSPDLIFAPRVDDAHQDHRLLARLVTTSWRNSLVLHYEIPKWDGDLGPVTHYVPVTAERAARKVELLNDSFPSQVGRDWWDAETFHALMRLRGVESRSRYAEAFSVTKAVVDLGGPDGQGT
jgi:LmbE family N-acetylglucosaminyl deacetylase